MEKRAINLEEIIKSPEIFENGTRQDGWTKYQVESICLEFGKQLLELAAENAKLGYESENINIQNGAKYNAGGSIVDKQSILDTIKQVK